MPKVSSEQNLLKLMEYLDGGISPVILEKLRYVHWVILGVSHFVTKGYRSGVAG